MGCLRRLVKVALRAQGSQYYSELALTDLRTEEPDEKSVLHAMGKILKNRQDICFKHSMHIIMSTTDYY